MNPNFRFLVKTARQMGKHVIDRCNLTVLLTQDDLAEFLAINQVEIIASLPCYLEENVDKQRGNGVFQDSIIALKKLNQLGYGHDLTLNLVFNPQGPTLPSPQSNLEIEYKKFLHEKYNITFNQLYTICNMPIQRFGSSLISKEKFNDYMQILRNAHQDANLATVMCRNLISIDWQGCAYDCDFNQMLGLSSNIHISQLNAASLQGNPIIVAEHCYACTAGQGSSCGGALT
ncbi:arsenosugar biosynthesis radical SAM protein ArsS [Thiotrichales bacterium HSG1]|nr:arsenosugar biosynthesis radical SAM protein ArsS [Thiotrichales bacterium HSG1]